MQMLVFVGSETPKPYLLLICRFPRAVSYEPFIKAPPLYKYDQTDSSISQQQVLKALSTLQASSLILQSINGCFMHACIPLQAIYSTLVHGLRRIRWRSNKWNSGGSHRRSFKFHDPWLREERRPGILSQPSDPQRLLVLQTPSKNEHGRQEAANQRAAFQARPWPSWPLNFYFC